MAEKTIKRRLEEVDGPLAADDGPIFSTVAKLVEALSRAIPESRDLEKKKEALRLGATCCAARSMRRSDDWVSEARSQFLKKYQRAAPAINHQTHQKRPSAAAALPRQMTDGSKRVTPDELRSRVISSSCLPIFRTSASR